MNASHWRSHPERAIEAWFMVDGHTGDGTREKHAEFLSAHRLSGATHPLLTLAPTDWKRPFRPAEGAARRTLRAGA